MDKIIKFEIPQFNYGNQTQNSFIFTNEYGEWFIYLYCISNCFNGCIYFKPNSDFSHLDSSTKPTVKFTPIDNYSGVHQLFSTNFIAENIAYISNLYTNGHHIFSFKVEIDVSNFPSPRKQEAIVGSKKHLKNIFENELDADITIKSEEKEFKAHKLILIRSEVFDKMLNNSQTKEAQEGIIDIKDVEYEVLYEMIRYLYYDEIPKIEEFALALLIAGNKYMIPDLVSECSIYLMKNIATESFDEILIAADKLDIADLKDTAINFVIMNRKKIFSSEGWKGLKKNHMSLAMEVMEKFVCDA